MKTRKWKVGNEKQKMKDWEMNTRYWKWENNLLGSCSQVVPMVVLDGVSGPEREGRGGSQKHEIIVSSSVASFCIPHSEFRPPGGQRILEIYDQADGSLPTVLPMVVLDGVSRPEEGGWFTKNEIYYQAPWLHSECPIPHLSSRRPRDIENIWSSEWIVSNSATNGCTGRCLWSRERERAVHRKPERI